MSTEARTGGRWVLPDGFRLKFAFRSIPPGCFAKSGEVIENALVVGRHFSRVWKLMKRMDFRVGVDRTNSSLGGVERKVGLRFGR